MSHHGSLVRRFGVPLRIAFALAAPFLTGCDWSNEPDYRDRLSRVSSVAAPDSAALGSRIDVDITTWGPNGCWRKGHDTVSRPGPLLARISPYDRESVREGVCTDNIVEFHHVVPLTATAPGTLQIEVRTRLRSSTGEDSVGTIQKFVTVY